MATINELSAKFNKMTLAQKKSFILNLKKQVEASNNPSHKKFLNECIQKYNTEYQASSQQIPIERMIDDEPPPIPADATSARAHTNSIYKAQIIYGLLCLAGVAIVFFIIINAIGNLGKRANNSIASSTATPSPSITSSSSSSSTPPLSPSPSPSNSPSQSVKSIERTKTYTDPSENISFSYTAEWSVPTDGTSDSGDVIARLCTTSLHFEALYYLQYGTAIGVINEFSFDVGNQDFYLEFGYYEHTNVQDIIISTLSDDFLKIFIAVGTPIDESLFSFDTESGTMETPNGISVLSIAVTEHKTQLTAFLQIIPISSNKSAVFRYFGKTESIAQIIPEMRCITDSFVVGNSASINSSEEAQPSTSVQSPSASGSSATNKARADELAVTLAAVIFEENTGRRATDVFLDDSDDYYRYKVRVWSGNERYNVYFRLSQDLTSYECPLFPAILDNFQIEDKGVKPDDWID